MEWKISDKPVEYEEAVRAMEERVAAIRGGTAEELVWLLEHPPIYTAGSSAKPGDLLNPCFPVFKTGRGGQYTYHGPGQRVAYVMLDLKKRQKAPDIKKYICDLEQWIIDTLKEFDIKGERRKGRVGIWVSSSPSPHESAGADSWGEGVKQEFSEKKIAALGVRVRHWVTYHGIAINVHPDLSHFDGIVPCGISDSGVTSIQEQNKEVNMQALDAVLKSNFQYIFRD